MYAYAKSGFTFANFYWRDLVRDLFIYLFFFFYQIYSYNSKNYPTHRVVIVIEERILINIFSRSVIYNTMSHFFLMDRASIFAAITRFAK